MEGTNSFAKQPSLVAEFGYRKRQENILCGKSESPETKETIHSIMN